MIVGSLSNGKHDYYYYYYYYYYCYYYYYYYVSLSAPQPRYLKPRYLSQPSSHSLSTVISRSQRNQCAKD